MGSVWKDSSREKDGGGASSDQIMKDLECHMKDLGSFSFFFFFK